MLRGPRPKLGAKNAGEDVSTAKIRKAAAQYFDSRTRIFRNSSSLETAAAATVEEIRHLFR